MRSARGRLLERFTDEQCLTAAARRLGLGVGLRQRRAWKARRGPTWEAWAALSREEKLAALGAAGEKPSRSEGRAEAPATAGG